MTFISVDLPDPDGPMIATYSPRSTLNVKPRSASTRSAPLEYVLVTSRISMTRSLIAQRLDRIQFGGTIGRIRSEHYRHERRERCRDDRYFDPRNCAVHPRDACDETLIDDESEQHAEQHAHDASERRQQQRLDEKLQQDLRTPRADCLTHANFACTFRNGDEHDVHDADTGDDERDSADRADDHADDAEKAVDGLREKTEIEILVLRPVRLLKHRLRLRFGRVEICSLRREHRQTEETAAALVVVIERRPRDSDVIADVQAEGSRFDLRLAQNADDHVAAAADVKRSSQRILRGMRIRKEPAVCVVRNNADGRGASNIARVDCAARGERRRTETLVRFAAEAQPRVVVAG